MKIKNFFLAYLVVAVLILQNSFSQAKQTQSQSGRAISLIPKFELKLNEKGMPGAFSGKSAMCEISSVVYEPKGPLEPNSFFCATVTYKATGENYFTEQTKLSPANKSAASDISFFIRSRSFFLCLATKRFVQFLRASSFMFASCSASSF